MTRLSQKRKRVSEVFVCFSCTGLLVNEYVLLKGEVAVKDDSEVANVC